MSRLWRHGRGDMSRRLEFSTFRDQPATSIGPRLLTALTNFKEA